MTHRRWTRPGVILSLAGLAVGVAITQAFPHQYGGGTVRLRGWLVVLSCAMAAPSMLGAGCLARGASGRSSRLLFSAAAAAWLAHAVVIGALIDRPLAAAGGWVTLLTVLVCAPSALRALALCRSRRVWPLGVVDLGVAVFAWAQIPVEVIARSHVGQATWWMMIPCALALAVMGVDRDA